MDRRRALGAAGEDAALAWYLGQGYELVARNWRRKEGEIDIIVRKIRSYVFCEVKTRSSLAFGSPAEAVSATKRARLRHLAARWLSEEAPGPARQIRFDVASVMLRPGNQAHVEIIEGAF